MEHIEENEEARLNAADMFINNSITGQYMDPEGEQENNEDQLDEEVQQDDGREKDSGSVGQELPLSVFARWEEPLRRVRAGSTWEVACGIWRAGREVGVSACHS